MEKPADWLQLIVRPLHWGLKAPESTRSSKSYLNGREIDSSGGASNPLA